MPLTKDSDAQDVVGIGKSGVWQYGLLQFLEPCSNKKPKASYTGCPNCLHLWRTFYELLWTFYEHFLRKMLKFDDFSQNAGGLVCFPPFSFLSSSSSKYEPLIKSMIFLYSPYPFPSNIHFHLIPFKRGGPHRASLIRGPSFSSFLLLRWVLTFVYVHILSIWFISSPYIKLCVSL